MFSPSSRLRGDKLAPTKRAWFAASALTTNGQDSGSAIAVIAPPACSTAESRSASAGRHDRAAGPICRVASSDARGLALALVGAFGVVGGRAIGVTRRLLQSHCRHSRAKRQCE